jgi:hypothetical protein
LALRHTQLKKLRTTSKRLLPSIEQLELQMQALDDESNTDKEIRRLAHLLYVGQLVEQVGLLYSLNEQTFYQFLLEHKKALQKPTGKDT